MPLKYRLTSRGFSLYTFLDDADTECSLQESSIATECIWLGVSGERPNRMHLTRDMVRELLPILQKFVDTGEITQLGEENGY